MNAKNASPGAEHPTKDTPRPGRDAREDAQNDSSDASHDNPPNHRQPTNGINAFLYWVGETGRIDEIDDLENELPDHFQVWANQHATQQQLERWSK